MARLRTAFGVTTTAPLSEPSQRITRPSTDPEKADEKADEATLEVHTTEQLVVNAEDERFEWGEVLRGRRAPLSYATAAQLLL